MESITHIERYWPHELSTKYYAVRLYRLVRNVSFVCRRYKISESIADALEQGLRQEGCKATRPADPKASGYTFGGWYADATFSAKVDFNTAITANTTIYAKWTENSAAPADPTSPQTGDTSDVFLWIALLLVSGGALTVTALYCSG